MTRTQLTPILLAATLLAGATTLSGCEELPLGDKTSVYYWADLFLDMYEDELVVGELEPGPEPLETPRAVLLITGVTIPAQWFDPIVARLERDGFVPWVYEPPELLSGSLFQATEDLADVVQQVLQESGQDQIDILAECTGGVIARHYIQSLGGDAFVSRLVTFVSPQHGVDKAPLAAMIAGWPALTDLSPGSAFLEAVNSVPLPETVPVTSIYTCSDEYIQPWQGSMIPGATNIGLCDEFVGHFQTFYDPEIYLIMHGALTEPTGFEPEPEPEVDETPEPGVDETPEPEVDETPEPEVDETPEPEVDEALADDPAPATNDVRPDEAGWSPTFDMPSGPNANPTTLSDASEQEQGCSAGQSGAPGLPLLALALAGFVLGLRRRGAPRLTSL